MRGLFYLFFVFAASSGMAGIQTLSQTLKVDKVPALGFYSDYLLYIPSQLQTSDEGRARIMVLPNNTGTSSDDIKVHEEAAIRKTLKMRQKFADILGVVLLRPIFPRPHERWKIYTHALDRDVMLVEDKDVYRLDLQLIQMLQHASGVLTELNISVFKKIFMSGFSASGMFTNRFTILHPNLVAKAAFGSPGGWPIAPVAEYAGEILRYPIGVADLKEVSGISFDIAAFAKVPKFLYIGDLDFNDSVPYRDGYEIEDEELIFKLFGNDPQERWKYSEDLYKDLNTQIKVYPDIAHTITNDMLQDMVSFFKSENTEK